MTRVLAWGMTLVRQENLGLQLELMGGYRRGKNTGMKGARP